jgi:hypothetical protein
LETARVDAPRRTPLHRPHAAPGAASRPPEPSRPRHRRAEPAPAPSAPGRPVPLLAETVALLARSAAMRGGPNPDAVRLDSFSS